MLPIKTILCPTDFSDASIEAMKQAGELAAHFDAELLLLHVTQTLDPVYGFAPYTGIVINIEALRRSVHQGAHDELNELAASPDFADLYTRVLVREGHPASQIVDAAEFEGADLIVISTHGQTGWNHLASGLVTESVIRAAKCPVLTVSPRKTDGPAEIVRYDSADHSENLRHVHEHQLAW